MFRDAPGKAAGVFTLVLDALKGSIAVWLRGLLMDQRRTADWMDSRSSDCDDCAVTFFLSGWGFAVVREWRLELEFS